jgi:hypothetical protein
MSMAAIVVRSIGMSIAIEGLGPAGLDPSRLLATLAAEHGEAVAGVGCPTEIVLIDRSALAWNGALGVVEEWARSAGVEVTPWQLSRCQGSRSARMECPDVESTDPPEPRTK